MTDQVADPVTPFIAEPTPAVAPAPVAPVADPQPVAQAPAIQLPESVREFVGVGKKYASAEDALSSIPHAQSHIDKLEDEMANLREDIAKNKTAEEVLEAINKKPSEQEPVTQFDPEQLDALIDTRLAQKQDNADKAVNVQAVVDRFIQEFGDADKAHEVYKQKAQDLGLSVEYINDLSSKSPSAVYELFGLKPAQHVPQRIQTNVNSEAVNNQAPAVPVLKSVMGQSTHKADIAAWNAAAPTE